MIGLSANAGIDYGVGDVDRAELAKSIGLFMAAIGERKAATSLSVSVARLKALASDIDSNLRIVAARLPTALALHSKLNHDRNAELYRLRESVERDGLRETARRMGLDPSNLRRKLLSRRKI